MNLLFNFSFLGISLVVLFVLFAILRLYRVRFARIVIGGVGLFAGLLISALISIFAEELPDPWSAYISFGALFLFGFGGMYLFLINEETVNNFFQNMMKFLSAISKFSESERAKKVFLGGGIVLDTSTFIDGRIEDLLKTGFIQEKIIIPRAVINEMHLLSDSPDDLKREKGKRGLKIMEKVQKMHSTEILADNYPDIKEVDEKLVRISKEKNMALMTVDYNLNKVARIQGLRVLNVNELANALRMVFIPGEEFEIKIVQEGKEKRQGVGYLPDGTMIVVDDAANLVGKKVDVTVSKSLQTEAGRMIFATIKNGKKD